MAKKWENEPIPVCYSEAVFSAASTVFEGGGDDGRGFGGFTFFVMQGQPSRC